MLTVFASQSIRPEIEAMDRDPGIVSLLSALIRFARRAGQSATAHVRAYHQVANEAELFSSSTAWPYNRR